MRNIQKRIAFRFNRYIVECKCGWAGTIEEMISEDLIDT